MGSRIGKLGVPASDLEHTIFDPEPQIKEYSSHTAFMPVMIVLRYTQAIETCRDQLRV
jgi:hypothetical protein